MSLSVKRQMAIARAQMLSRLRQLFGSDVPPSSAAVPAGQRVYAVGDIHGRADLFAELITAIEADDAARAPATTTVILLGDLIDRGPDSAGVIRLARDWQARRTVRILTGNHEEMFLAALHRADVMRPFLRFGGRETLLSYPIDPEAYSRADIDEVMELARAAVPAEDLTFIAGFEDQVTIGDYHFVHAGVRPGQPLDAQRLGDLRWIREPFLTWAGDFGAVVVHGHTITEEPAIRANRIGIDTGAFDSGRLTALGLEGTDRWLLQTAETAGGVSVTTGDLQ
ncbi:MAG: metallophosphoesterase [Brevundimonas sp.]|jgi:serine/threonine protein phosphatase 1|nr:metallophosphoesterase [Brevundimonas sp.]